MKAFFSNWQCSSATGCAEQAKSFIDEYGKLNNVPLNDDYVLRSNSITVYKDGKYLGGEILNKNAPYRYFEVFEDEAQKMAILKNEEIEEDQIMEITAIHHVKSIKPLERLIFFGILYYHGWHYAKKNGKTIIMGGSIIKAVQRYQLRALTRILVCMPLNKSFAIHGITSSVAKVYYIQRSRFLRNVTLLLISDSFAVIKKTIKRLFTFHTPSKLGGKMVMQR